MKQRRPPSCAGLSFPTDTRAGRQRQHSHALPPPHPYSWGLEPKPLLFFLLAPCPGRLCLALAPDPPGSVGGRVGERQLVRPPSAPRCQSPSQRSAFLESPRLPMQTGFPSRLACRLEPNSSATCSRENDEEGGLQGSGRSKLLAASRPEPGPAGSTSTHAVQADTCPAAAHNFHCWEVPRTSNPNTSSCRTSFGLSLSARAQACLEQDRAVPTPAGRGSLGT